MACSDSHDIEWVGLDAGDPSTSSDPDYEELTLRIALQRSQIDRGGSSSSTVSPSFQVGSSSFGSDDFNVDPVRVGSPTGASAYGKKSTFFDDSVPSSPAYTSGFSPKFGESRDDSSSYNFGRFDSFRSQDSAVPQESRFSRFDSVTSSKGESAAGFDSSNSSRNFGRFDSFDEADPFGSTGPFKASGARSPPKF